MPLVVRIWSDEQLLLRKGVSIFNKCEQVGPGGECNHECMHGSLDHITLTFEQVAQ